MSQYENIQETAAYIRNKVDIRAKDALILGSGLGALAEVLSNPYVLPYQELPHWPTSAVQGHAGNLVVGDLEGVPVMIMQGRSHYYEGWSPLEVTFPVRVFAALGVERLLVTNSAGGVNQTYQPGDLMLIIDHINLTGYNPLIGPNDDRLGPRFPDMTYAYTLELRDKLREAATSLEIQMKEGVYVGLSGPAYETPAEIRMLEGMGADAVGMSTVPEVIVANHAGLKVAGVSCITNMAAGISKTTLNHDEVKETADRVRDHFMNLVKSYIVAVAGASQ